MSIYNDSINTGELWSRKINDNIEISNQSLSAIYSKYESINPYFYNDLVKNNIKNIDVFYDCIFIETDTGYIIEKFFMDDEYNLYPTNGNNFLTIKRNTSTKYWFDENELKVYFFDILAGDQPTNAIVFNLIVKEFNCKSGFLFLKIDDLIVLNLTTSKGWGRKVPVVEPPVVSYNEYIKNFNCSFIMRNNTSDISLISLNIDKKVELELNRINGFIPFATVDQITHISR